MLFIKIKSNHLIISYIFIAKFLSEKTSTFLFRNPEKDIILSVVIDFKTFFPVDKDNVFVFYSYYEFELYYFRHKMETVRIKILKTLVTSTCVLKKF